MVDPCAVSQDPLGEKRQNSGNGPQMGSFVRGNEAPPIIEKHESRGTDYGTNCIFSSGYYTERN